MTGFLDKLNLRAAEKRLVVVVVVVVFVVLNLWFVIPRFGDWTRTKNRMAQAQRKLGGYQVEIGQMRNYQTQVRAMESEGASVPAEEQAVQFSRAIQMQQAQSGVNIIGTSKQSTRTNQFFLELTQVVSVQSGEPQLVDFLYTLGSGNSLIRVRDLTVKPDVTRQQLSSNVKLVASYQKKQAVRPAAPATKPPASPPATKPAPPPKGIQPVAAPSATKAPATPATTKAPAPPASKAPAPAPAGPKQSPNSTAK